jgi:predicted ferric reductase
MYQLHDLQSVSAPPKPRTTIAGFAGVILFCLVGAVSLVIIGLYLPATAAHGYWFISRSSGVVAYLLLTLGVLWGLVQSGALFRTRASPLLALGLHSYLSWLGLGLALLHGIILLNDSYMDMGVAQIGIPFVSTYRPLPMGLGIIGFYLMLLLTLSFYARPYLGQRAFRTLHYASFGVFVMVTAHGVLAGTDSWPLWWMYAASVGAVVALTAARILSTRAAAFIRTGAKTDSPQRKIVHS